VAPEIIELNPATPAVDIWSVGCTVIELLTGEPPYFNLDPMPALYRIVQDEHPPLPPDCSPACKDFLLQCFQKDPNLRKSADKLLNHPWIKQAKKAATAPPNTQQQQLLDKNDNHIHRTPSGEINIELDSNAKPMSPIHLNQVNAEVIKPQLAIAPALGAAAPAVGTQPKDTIAAKLAKLKEDDKDDDKWGEEEEEDDWDVADKKVNSTGGAGGLLKLPATSDKTEHTGKATTGNTGPVMMPLSGGSSSKEANDDKKRMSRRLPDLRKSMAKRMCFLRGVIYTFFIYLFILILLFYFT